jgi:pimeloyl-ACP methyl ester carboxylesterase
MTQSKRHNKMNIAAIVFVAGGIVILLLIAAGAALVATPPRTPPVMEAIAAPFRAMNFTTLPPVSEYSARDGAKLTYLAYPSASAKHTVVLIHGSSAGGNSMHVLAEYLQRNSIDAYALDMRGHGDSGRRGDIEYIGQLEDDLEDFVEKVIKGEKNVTLVGLSAGGGFVLRFAAGDRQMLFDRYIALAPFIRYDAPTTRPDNGEWAKASVPRILAITVLGAAGQKWLGHLPVIAFGINPQTAPYQTASYSYRLWSNFGLHYDYKADLKAIKRPLIVMVGDQDELFYPQKYLSVFAEAQPHADIRLVPGVGHITLTTQPIGLAMITEAVLNSYDDD